MYAGQDHIDGDRAKGTQKGAWEPFIFEPTACAVHCVREDPVEEDCHTFTVGYK